MNDFTHLPHNPNTQSPSTVRPEDTEEDLNRYFHNPLWFNRPSKKGTNTNGNHCVCSDIYGLLKMKKTDSIA